MISIGHRIKFDTNHSHIGFSTKLVIATIHDESGQRRAIG